MGFFSGSPASPSSSETSFNDIIVVSGPNGGAGVRGMIQSVMDRFPQVTWCISYTTRKPRLNEVDGKDYWFVTAEEMNERINDEEFLEYAQVHGDYYGTSVEQVEQFLAQSDNETNKFRKKSVCIINMDVQGVKLAKHRPYLCDARYVFVTPSSLQDLQQNLEVRKVESVRKRVSNAKRDIKYGENSGNFHVVIKAPQGEADGSNNPLALVIKEWYPTLQDLVMPRPVVFCGPSGVGKGTLIEMLQWRFQKDQFGFSVSHTTRQPREGENHGVHYYFTSVEQMKQDIDKGLFVEHAEVHGNYYGISIEAIQSVQRSGKICILDIDVQGVQSIKKSSLSRNPIYLFIAPPSMTELERRLRGRGTETQEAVAKRLASAKRELEYGQEAGNFDQIFVNGDLEATFHELTLAFKEWYPHLVERGENDGAPKKTCTSAATSSCVVS